MVGNMPVDVQLLFENFIEIISKCTCQVSQFKNCVCKIKYSFQFILVLIKSFENVYSFKIQLKPQNIREEISAGKWQP